MSDKLNNLLSIDEITEKDFMEKATPTKRTEVAKDVLKENAYVEGKDIFGETMKSKEEHNSGGLHNLISLEDFTNNVPNTESKPTKRTEVAKDVIKENAYVEGKDIFGETMTSKEEHKSQGLSNLISFSDFSKDVPDTSSKSTKRTEVAKDVLLEKNKKAQDCEDEDDKECDDDEPKKGLTAKQKKLPEFIQKKILAKQGK